MSDFKALKNTVEMNYNGQQFTWGDAKNFILFAGPDIVEDQGMVLEVAQELKKITTDLKIPWILKCSFDKANRQSLGSFRGPGMKAALESFGRIKSRVGCPLLTDVHETVQVPAVDILGDQTAHAFLHHERKIIWDKQDHVQMLATENSIFLELQVFIECKDRVLESNIIGYHLRVLNCATATAAPPPARHRGH